MIHALEIRRIPSSLDPMARIGDPGCSPLFSCPLGEPIERRDSLHENVGVVLIDLRS